MEPRTLSRPARPVSFLTMPGSASSSSSPLSERQATPSRAKSEMARKGHFGFGPRSDLMNSGSSTSASSGNIFSRNAVSVMPTRLQSKSEALLSISSRVEGVMIACSAPVVAAFWSAARLAYATGAATAKWAMPRAFSASRARAFANCPGADGQSTATHPASMSPVTHVRPASGRSRSVSASGASTALPALCRRTPKSWNAFASSKTT
mmetsp:Transcript_27996/g.83903  ORF Transcript_27996/g.83903 Transcript_27996/m.83903 type:complete len:208 (-) Transcript_27996:325-948(-)